MKLKEHPAVRILSTWPPVWVHTRADKIHGEVGVLSGTEISEMMPTALFLKMDFNQKQYVGFLSVNDPAFCSRLNQLLSEHVGRTIEEIGALDV